MYCMSLNVPMVMSRGMMLTDFVTMRCALWDDGGVTNARRFNNRPVGIRAVVIHVLCHLLSVNCSRDDVCFCYFSALWCGCLWTPQAFELAPWYELWVCEYVVMSCVICIVMDQMFNVDFRGMCDLLSFVSVLAEELPLRFICVLDR